MDIILRTACREPFQSLPDYEEFIYGLGLKYPDIQSSTLVLARRGPGLAALIGDEWFQGGYRLAVYEILTWDLGVDFLTDYEMDIEVTFVLREGASDVMFSAKTMVCLCFLKGEFSMTIW